MLNSAREVINCRYILINNTCALILYTLYYTVLYSCMCTVYEKTLPCTNWNNEALHTIFARNIFFFVGWDVLLPFVQSSVMIKDFTIFYKNFITFHSFSVFRGVFRPQIYVISQLKWLKYWSLKVVGKLRPNKKNLEFLIRHPIGWNGEKAILRYFPSTLCKQRDKIYFEENSRDRHHHILPKLCLHSQT
jgi:hypothetical protein